MSNGDMKLLARVKKEAEAEVKKEAQLEVLARFCGGKRWWSHESSGQQSEPGWLFPSLKEKGYAWPVIMCDRWNPREDGNQLLMVLDGLVKKTMERFTAYTKDKACRIILHQLATMPEMPEDNWLGNVVCAAGLEVINRKDGG